MMTMMPGDGGGVHEIRVYQNARRDGSWVRFGFVLGSFVSCNLCNMCGLRGEQGFRSRFFYGMPGRCALAPYAFLSPSALAQGWGGKARMRGGSDGWQRDYCGEIPATQGARECGRARAAYRISTSKPARQEPIATASPRAVGTIDWDSRPMMPKAVAKRPMKGAVAATVARPSRPRAIRRWTSAADRSAACWAAVNREGGFASLQYVSRFGRPSRLASAPYDVAATIRKFALQRLKGVCAP